MELYHPIRTRVSFTGSGCVLFFLSMTETSLYFHIPFCNRRCGYCDFNTFAGLNSLLPVYVDAICQEIELIAKASPQKINVGTLFFGGGTPSLLSPQQVERILETCASVAEISSSAEITLEANPGTVTAESIHAYRSMGINRISFGMQSAHPDDLRILDRQHHHSDVIQSVLWSQQAGFKHVNLDLIFGIPGQGLERWKNTLRLALLEGVDHYSLYSLSVEDGTPMQQWVDRGLLPAPEDDLAASMYETAIQILDQHGFTQYEISNWANSIAGERDARCRHNLQYWRGLPYLGFGAGAHGFSHGVRTENVSAVREYIARIQQGQEGEFPASPACKTAVNLSSWEQMQEYMMVGFRLTDEGVSRKLFRDRFDAAIDEMFEKQIKRLLKQRLIEINPGDEDRYRLTLSGRLFGNRVFTEFVGNRPPVKRESP